MVPAVASLAVELDLVVDSDAGLPRACGGPGSDILGRTDADDDDVVDGPEEGALEDCLLSAVPL